MLIATRVMHAAGVEVLAQQARGDFLDFGRVSDAAQLFIERDQERPLNGHSVCADSIGAWAGRPTSHHVIRYATFFQSTIRSAPATNVATKRTATS